MTLIAFLVSAAIAIALPTTPAKSIGTTYRVVRKFQAFLQEYSSKLESIWFVDSESPTQLPSDFLLADYVAATVDTPCLLSKLAGGAASKMNHLLLKVANKPFKFTPVSSIVVISIDRIPANVKNGPSLIPVIENLGNSNLYFIFLTALPCESLLTLDQALEWKINHKLFIAPAENCAKVLSNRTLWCDGVSELSPRTLPTSLATRIPGVQVRKAQNGELQLFKTGGHHLRFTIEAARHLNFTLSFVTSTGGGGTGFKMANSTWNGVVGDVLYGRAKLGVASGVTLDRYLIVHSISAIDYLSVIFLHAAPKRSVKGNFMFRPFTLRLWLLVGTSAFTILAFVILNNVISRIFGSQGQPRFADLAVAILGTFFNQGSPALRRAKEAALLIILSHWLVFVLVISTAYASRLFALYTVMPTERMPTTFKELAKSDDLEIGFSYYGGALYNFFGSMLPNSPGAKIFKRMIKMRPPDCLARAEKPNFVCVTFDLDVKFYTNTRLERVRPNIVVSSEVAMQMPGTSIISRNSVLKESFENAFRSLSQGGFSDYWLSRTFGDIRSERLNIGESSRVFMVKSRGSFGYTQCINIIVALQPILAIAAAVFLLEWLVWIIWYPYRLKLCMLKLKYLLWHGWYQLGRFCRNFSMYCNSQEFIF